MPLGAGGVPAPQGCAAGGARSRAHGLRMRRAQADEISCFNRHWAERSGYWEKTTFFEEEGRDAKIKPGVTVFYDSVTSEPLFQAPVGRYLRVCARARVPGCLRSTLQCARVCLSSTPEAYPLLCVHGSGTPFTIWQELGGFCARVTASRLAFV